MIGIAPKNISFLKRLIPSLKNKKFRDGYLSRQLKVFLAAQIRALRGDLTQGKFGKVIGKPQSVVSRLERQSYGHINLQTLIDIATKLNIGLVIRFVDLPTFLKWTSDTSATALAPEPYSEAQLDEFSRELENAVSKPKEIKLKSTGPNEPIQVFGIEPGGITVEIPPLRGDEIARKGQPSIAVTHNDSVGSVSSLQ